MRGTRCMMAAKRCGTHGDPCNALSSVPIRNCIPRSTISSARCQHATSRILFVSVSGPCRSFFVPAEREKEREKKEGNNRKLCESHWPTARCRLTDPVCAARSNICLERRSLCVSTMMNVYTSCAAENFPSGASLNSDNWI